MLTRILTAIIAIVIALGIIFLGELNSIVLAIAISLVCAICFYEFLHVKGLHKDLKILIPSLIFSFLTPLLSYTQYRFIPLYLFTLTIVILSVRFHDTIDIENVIFMLFGILIIVLPMTAFTYYSCKDNKYTAFYIVLTLAIPWLSDSGAYFTGTLFGKHKLCPNISPKKTVEGVIGALVFGVLSSIVIYFVFKLIYPKAVMNLLLIIIIAIVNTILSIFGDLFFSIIKRKYEIKDYGNILPGHGGMLDRFDSVVICIPVVFILSQIFNIIA